MNPHPEREHVAEACKAEGRVAGMHAAVTRTAGEHPAGTRGQTAPYVLIFASQALLALVALAGGALASLSVGFFAIVAVTAVVCAVADVPLVRAFRASRERVFAAQKAQLLEEQLAAQEDHKARLASEVEAARALRANMGCELDEIDALLAQGNVGEACSRMGSAPGSSARVCENLVVDALLQGKRTACDEQGIHAEFAVALPMDAGLPDVELCAAFSNLVDNAIHACGPGGWLKVVARIDKGYLVVAVENSVAPVRKAEKGSERSQVALNGAGLARVPKTHGAGAARSLETHGEPGRTASNAPTVSREHGWGLGILQALAESHSGSFKTEQGETFKATLILKLAK